jgi:hypothetical protein
MLLAATQLLRVAFTSMKRFDSPIPVTTAQKAFSACLDQALTEAFRGCVIEMIPGMHSQRVRPLVAHRVPSDPAAHIEPTLRVHGKQPGFPPEIH